MKDLSLLVWLTQLGLSAAVPLAMFVLLGVWLNRSCGWGIWTVFVGLGLGLWFGINGLIGSLKTMEQMSRNKNEKAPPVSFNEHD